MTIIKSDSHGQSRIASSHRTCQAVVIAAVLAQSAALSSLAQQVENGSFEQGLSGWNTSGNIDVDPTYTAAQGVKALVFNAGQSVPNGVVSQSITTEPGQDYTLSFDVGAFSLVERHEQRLEVTVQGSNALLDRTISEVASASGVRYAPYELRFTAESPNTQITFRDVSTETWNTDLLLDNVRVSVNSAPGSAAPEIAVHPASVTATSGDAVALSATATGGGVLSYQWRFNGVNIPGANSSVYPLGSVQANQAGSYDVVVSNSAGTVTSAAAVLTVLTEVPVTSGPISRSTVAALESLNGLAFSTAQQNQILQTLSGGVQGMVDGKMLSLDGWSSIRSIPLLNSDAPAVVFDPKPFGFTINQDQEPIAWSAPSNVSLPADRSALAFYSVRELAELIQTRQITSSELTQLYLARLKRYAPALLCVVTLTEELALRKAQEADQEIAAGRYRGLLHGIPYGLKDVFAVKGYPTTWGAEPYRNQMLDQDAAVYRKLDEAGAILVAKLATGALAAGDKWFGGQTRNPWNPRAPSGGSSSGPAAATAAGLVGFAIGTETMGSIVDPSAQCQVAGLRSSFGRVSRSGAMSLAWSLDKIGPICRSVEGCAIVLDAIRGVDDSDRATMPGAFNFRADRGLGGIKVGYVAGAVESSVLNTVSSLGGQVASITLPNYPSGALLSILAVEGAAAFDYLTRSGGLNSLPAQGPNDLPNMFRTARTVSAVDYIQADRLRSKLVQDLGDLFKTVDLFITPYAQDANLAIANLAGLPCVAIPTGAGRSLLFVGPLFGEARILEAANAYQTAVGYRWQPPSGFVE